MWYDQQITFDGAIITLDAKFAASTYVKSGANDVVQDMWCKATIDTGKYSSTDCKTDTVGEATVKEVAGNGYLTDADAAKNYCVETWTMGTIKKCQRLSISTDRLWTTADNTYVDAATSLKIVDMNLQYRKYSVTTGWRIPAAAANAPAKQDFAAVNVDFSSFLRSAETYSAALYKLQLAGSAVVGVIAALAW